MSDAPVAGAEEAEKNTERAANVPRSRRSLAWGYCFGKRVRHATIPYHELLRNGHQAARNAVEYTLTEAAEATGLSRPTIFRAIKKGTLSARREPDKSYRIDASELARVFPSVSLKQSDDTIRHDVKRGETAETLESSGAELALLRRELQIAREQAAREREVTAQIRELVDRERETFRETVEDLRKRLDRAEERILALAAPAAPEKPQDGPSGVPAGVETSRSPRGFLSRLWGR